MAKNDHDYPATRILANGHTLVIASEGNNRIGMIASMGFVKILENKKAILMIFVG
jgi:hypothetical protein